jgi:hypothetical protein
MGIVKTNTVGPNQGTDLNLISGVGGHVYVNGQIISGSGSLIVGPQGPTGTPGSQGQKGATGAQGVTGATGAQGIPGNPGLDGAVAPAGLTWQGAWSSTQSYATNSVVGYASASWWSKISVPAAPFPLTPNSSPNTDNIHWSFLSAQGPAGIQGVQGPKGPTGPQGPTGIGLQGIQGIQGPTGAPGTGIASQVSYIPTGLSITGSNVQLALSQLDSVVTSQIPTSGTISVNTNFSTITLLSYDFNNVTGDGGGFAYLPSNPALGTKVTVNSFVPFTIYANADGSGNFVYDTTGLQQNNVSIGTQTVYVFTYLGLGGLGNGLWFKERMANIDEIIANIPLVTKTLYTSISATQVLQLNTTPIVVLPRINYYARVPTSIYIKRKPGNAYILADPTFQILDGDNNPIGTAIYVSNPLTGTASGFSNSTINLVQSGTNTTGTGPFKLQATSGNPISGSGDLDVFVTYNEFFLGY